MTGTRVVFAAYDESMETLIVLLLLAYAEKEEGFKEKLLKALAFYRENRALLMALSGVKEGEEAPAQKNSPPDGGENLRVLEEFLKKI